MEAKKEKIVGALLTAMFLAAFEGTVIAMAAPIIVRELQGFELISWMFSSYLLAAAISTPIYGKLADLYGRKNVLSIGILIFLCGSLCCGFSQTMVQLIFFRTTQGLGAGAILTVTFTIIGDIFTLQERSVVQGAISTVWGVAGVLGPMLGGVLIETLSWHWIFFLNVPFGLICIFILQSYLPNMGKKQHIVIDYAGTLALSVCIGDFLYIIMVGYQNQTWLPAAIIFLLSSLAFWYIERRAVEPIVPFSIVTRSSAIINSVAFFVSVLLIATTVYFPLYIQSVLGYSAMVAGITLAPMSISWFFSSILIARGMQRLGAYKIVIGAAILLLAGAIAFSTVTAASALTTVAAYSFIFGFGFSGTLNTLTFMVQDSVGYSRRGAAVGINALVRTLGQTVGVSFFGTMINVKVGELLATGEFGGTADLFSQENLAATTPLLLFGALHFVFLLLVAVAVIIVVTAFLLQRYRGT